MTRLRPESRALLDAFRTADALDARAHERMARGLFEKLAGGESPLAGIDASPPALPEMSWTAKLLGSTAAKLSTGVVALAAGATALTLTAAPDPSVTDSNPESTPPPPAAVAPPAAPQSELQPETSPPPSAAKPLATSRRPARRRRPEPPALVEPPPEVAAPSPLPEPPPPPEPEPEPTPHRVTSPLDSELGLLRRAYLELNASRPARALEAIDEHAYRFPRGELVESREVARMLALCGLDRELEAKALAKKFIETHPGSPFTGRVRALCPVSLPKTSP